MRRGLHFSEELITPENLARVRALNEIAAAARPDPGPAGDRLGPARPAGDLGADRRLAASRSSRTLAALDNADFDDAELAEIDQYAVDGALNIWAQSSDAQSQRPLRRAATAW